MSKTDINLIPRKRVVPASTVGLTLLVLILISAIVALGIYLPGHSLDVKKAKLAVLNDELASYADIDNRYAQKMNELTSLNTRKENLDKFISSDRQVLDIMRSLSACKPGGLYFTSQVYNNDNIVLSGFAENDLLIAEFEISLRTLDIFSNIYLESVLGTNDMRSFYFTLLYKENGQQSGGAK